MHNSVGIRDAVLARLAGEVFDVNQVQCCQQASRALYSIAWNRCIFLDFWVADVDKVRPPVSARHERKVGFQGIKFGYPPQMEFAKRFDLSVPIKGPRREFPP